MRATKPEVFLETLEYKKQLNTKTERTNFKNEFLITRLEFPGQLNDNKLDDTSDSFI